jgi:hypothetical protein
MKSNAAALQSSSRKEIENDNMKVVAWIQSRQPYRGNRSVSSGRQLLGVKAVPQASHYSRNISAKRPIVGRSPQAPATESIKTPACVAEEELMQNDPQQCSPDAVSKLQRAFDEIWRHLETSRNVGVFPWHVHASREKIATELCQRMDELFADPEILKRDILTKFGVAEYQERHRGKLSNNKVRAN